MSLMKNANPSTLGADTLKRFFWYNLVDLELLLAGLGESYGIFRKIVDSKVLSQQHISDNPDRAHRSRDVKTSERRDARVLHVEDVVRSFQLERFASKVEGKRRKVRNLGAVDSVLTVPAFSCTDFRVQDFGDISGESNEGGASVNCGSSVIKRHFFISKLDFLELDFPVALPSDGSIVDVAFVVTLVDTTKHGFTSRSTFTIVRIAKVEGKQVLVKQTLVDHVVEGRGSVQDGNGVVSQTEDTIEFTESESETWLFG